MINETQFFKNMFFIGAPIIVLALIVFFIGIGFFIARCNINNKDSKDNKTNTDTIKDFKIVTKKDMAYWFVMLVIFIIFWLSSYLYNDSKLVEYISFSGTIVSIILGIVAIIFSYFQNFTSSNTSEKLLETSNSLVSSLSSLDEYNENIGKYQNDIANIIESLNTLTNYMEDSASKLSKLGDSVEIVKNRVGSNTFPQTKWDSNLKNTNSNNNYTYENSWSDILAKLGSTSPKNSSISVKKSNKNNNKGDE